MRNGDFEEDNLGFSSDYSFNTLTLPGQYSIVTAAQAKSISPFWLATDHYACKGGTGTTKFMVVNGKTCQTTGSKVIWRETVAVDGGREYQFCANVKNFKQCTFDILPKIEVRFSQPSDSNILPTVVNTG